VIGNVLTFSEASAARPLPLPKVMTSPPTVGAASTTTILTSPVNVSALEAGAFTYSGGTAYRGAVPTNGGNFPAYLGVLLGAYPGSTSSSPVSIDFDIDTVDATGRFELYFTGNGLKVRVAVQNASGIWEYVTSGATWTLANDGNAYFLPLTMGAAGTYRIRVECAAGVKFRGVNCGATDSVRAAPKPRRRYIIVGDSYSEPTISDSGSNMSSDGWPQKLSYLTGFEVWSAGSGGTGYVNPNSGAGRQKFRDRLATDILPFTPDGVIFAGGINDTSFTTAAAVGVEAAACFDQVRAALPNCDLIAISPFWPSAITTNSTTNLLAVRDAIQAAAEARGIKFLDLLSLPAPAYLGSWSSTLQGATLVGATSIQVATVPDYFTYSTPGLNDWYVYIKDGASGEIRKVTAMSGSGPYTLTVGALTYAHSAGAGVQLAGPSYMTGSGKQGSTTGSGNADRYTGSDGTHPTVAGHAHIAYTIHSLWAKKLSTR
jgi:lysophospholipase L1-like esterase